MRPLIKLQTYDGSGSLEMFLMKFWHMDAYLRCDDKDTFHDLGASLQGAAGQVLWDIVPHVTMANIIYLLQTRFGT